VNLGDPGGIGRPCGEGGSSLAQPLDTVKSELEVTQQVRQSIGNPAAISEMIQSGLFSSYRRNSGITDTLSDFLNITQQGAKQSTVMLLTLGRLGGRGLKDCDQSGNGELLEGQTS
jgi:hypothetical protein